MIWGVGLAAYILAIFHRSSLAVAGLTAAERFDISASQLATFTTLQLLVYAGMQIPVGLLVDRWGPRAVMLTGAVTLTLAQAGFALAESYGAALGARVFVGVGDAMTWICLLRLVTTWFTGRRIPFVTALSGTLGQLGAIVAAAPMTWALGQLGWTTAYLVAAGLSVLATAAVALVVLDSPEDRVVRGPRLTLGGIRESLRACWTHPGTRLGFWMHFVTQFSATAMTLLWGFPFLVRGEGLSPAPGRAAAEPRRGRGDVQRADHRLAHRAAPVAPVDGGAHHRVGDRRRLDRRARLARQAPFWLLVLLTQVIGIGGPASMIGFDLARTSNPVERLASANGIINQAGFSASFVLVVAIGLVLDWRTPGVRHGLRRRRVPLGDGGPVPALGARAGAGLALPPPGPRGGRPRRAHRPRPGGGLSCRLS